MVSRRYTPPTCTLALTAKSSPLSRWTQKPTFKEIQFELSLDDPRLPEEQQITLRGDRDQLEALREAVETYVQTVLMHPIPAQIPTQSIVSQTSSEGIALHPQGLVHHELSLGSLASEQSGNFIRLSTLQLFDLATALEQYAEDVVALPSLPRTQRIATTPYSLRIAASALLAVGLTATGLKIFNDYSRPQVASVATNPAPTPSQTLQTSPRQLPPPPSVGIIEPSPDLTPEALPTVPPPPAPPDFSEPTPPPQTANSTESAPSTTVEIAPETTSIEPAPAPNPVAPPPLPTLEPRQTVAKAEGSSQAARMAPPAILRAADSQPETESAFDQIPQVAEARRYFQERWKAPESLEGVIEYRLTLNANGSIEQILPLGTAAENYLDRTGMPLTGEKFVSPLPDGKSAKIRVVLHGDNTVQTFLE